MLDMYRITGSPEPSQQASNYQVNPTNVVVEKILYSLFLGRGVTRLENKGTCLEDILWRKRGHFGQVYRSEFN